MDVVRVGTTELMRTETNLLARFLVRFDRDNTRRAYFRDLQEFFGTSQVDVDLAVQVKSEHVSVYLRELEQDGLKSTTIRRRLSVVRSFFNWCMAHQDIPIDHNPADRYLIGTIRKSARPHVVCLSKEQARQLLQTAQAGKETGLRDYTLLSVMLHCTLRRSEAAAMEVEHIQPSGPYWILTLPYSKGGEDEWVKMPDHVVDRIRQHQEHYDIATGALWRSHSRNHTRGEQLTGDGVYQLVKRLVRRAGLMDAVGAHTLRHTGCTLALEAGASLQQVQEHARHKDVSTTMIYIHQRDRLKDSAGDYIKL